jgi:hypothetical protein
MRPTSSLRRRSDLTLLPLSYNIYVFALTVLFPGLFCGLGGVEFSLKQYCTNESLFSTYFLPTVLRNQCFCIRSTWIQYSSITTRNTCQCCTILSFVGEVSMSFFFVFLYEYNFVGAPTMFVLIYRISSTNSTTIFVSVHTMYTSCTVI